MATALRNTFAVFTLHVAPAMLFIQCIELAPSKIIFCCFCIARGLYLGESCLPFFALHVAYALLHAESLFCYFTLHVTGTLLNLAFAVFTLHEAQTIRNYASVVFTLYVASTFVMILSLFVYSIWLTPKSSFCWFTLNVACTLQNCFYIVCDAHMTTACLVRNRNAYQRIVSITRDT